MVMAPRRKKTRGTVGGKTTSTAGSQQVPTCAFCDLPHSDDINGELLTRNGLHVHYFCMLFSSGLHQRGEEDDPLRGFMEADVRAELRRGNRLICCFCKRKNATVGCCLRACKKAFHMPCGVERDCLLQFFGDFRVYCAAHRPRQNVVPLEREGTSLCSICSEEMVHPSVDVLVTPCCRQMFHRKCIQRQAISAGSHFFRCGHCNNQEAFQREMQDHGIYVPDQDASWEREPHAYEDLLYRYQHCDAPRCSCPLGRSHHQEDGRWRMVVCDSCGSQGVHASCGNVAGTHWICADCRQIITRKIYNAAQKEEQLAAITSDLASEDGSSQHRRRQQQRRRRRATRLISSDEGRVCGVDNGGFSHGSEETSTHSLLQANFAPRPSPLAPLSSTTSRSTDVPSLAMTSEHTGYSAVPTSSVQGQTYRERNSQMSRRQKKILKELEKMTAELSTHVDILKKLEMSSYSLQAHAQNARPVDCGVLDVLPLTSHEGLQELENRLCTAQSRANLVSCLSTIGGSSPQDSMHHVMQRCMQDSYAQKFSMTGRKGKKPFMSLQLFSAMIEAVKKNFPDATDMMLRSYAADWLHYAPSRFQRSIGMHQRMPAVPARVA
ncbi:uncharacterized protein LOC142588226 isoform X1 [Dermacentor variabilis]|uniref:uncharacterized protein LOC142588226 isoform X1 n=1 Tax=Dermacentor variabilis TaxID=34621 RepID=UPI003F5BDA8E